MHPIVFTCGPLTIYSYGVMIASGVCVSFFLIKKHFIKTTVSTNVLIDCIVWSLAAGIVGARIFYVITHFGEFKNDLFSVVKLWEGGLVLYGGLIFGFIVLSFFAYRKRIGYFILADSLVPFLALTQGFGRVGCFLNGCCWGKVHHGLFSVRFPFLPTPVHPVQLYEALFCIVLFFYLCRRYKRRQFDGEITMLYLLLYSLGRFSIEFFRGDQQLLIVIFTRPQIISMGIFVSVAIAFPLIKRKYSHG
ncbi:MAG: prolipoprotein diacylglyceryl transferase [Candidatus Omnitrophica bacterium]|nr:prolipoprotein diacylglyceryl transferase [Candidatus Omnitrophota bacterium]